MNPLRCPSGLLSHKVGIVSSKLRICDLSGNPVSFPKNYPPKLVVLDVKTVGDAICVSTKQGLYFISDDTRRGLSCRKCLDHRARKIIEHKGIIYVLTVGHELIEIWDHESIRVISKNVNTVELKNGSLIYSDKASEYSYRCRDREEIIEEINNEMKERHEYFNSPVIWDE